jgi:hypothetical protein
MAKPTKRQAPATSSARAANARGAATLPPRKRSAMRKFGVALSAVIGLVLLFAIAIVLINLPDRALTQQAQSWLTHAPVKNGGNIGASLWALDAPAGTDAVALGTALHLAATSRTPDQIAQGDWTIKRPYSADPLILPLELGCLDRGSACVSSALSHSAMVRDLAAKRAAMLSRVDALDQGQAVTELAPAAVPHTPFAQYANLIAAHSLSLALASVDIGDAHLAAGTERLERMTRVARELLAGCTTLACKVSAAGMLRRSYMVYSELMSQTRAIAALAPSFERVAAPLSHQELDLTAALAYELQLAHYLDDELVHAADGHASGATEALAVRAAPLFFKENATFDLQVELAEIERPMISTTAADFASNASSTFAAFAHRANLIGETSLASLYDPLGRVLASGLPSLEQAAAQLHDIEALQAGVRAKTMLLLQHVTLAGAQALLNTRPVGAVDPYTGAALVFDQSKAALIISQRGPRPVSQLRVALDQ